MRTARDWQQPCPNQACSHYKLFRRGNISAIASYLTKSGRRRIFRCRVCDEQFSETRDTVFFDLRTEEEKVIMALKMLLVRCELSAISFVLGVTEETTLEWLRRAALKADEINRHLLREVPVQQVQLDEMWNFVRRKCSLQSEDGVESPALSEDGRQWVWVSFAPEFRLLLAVVVGPRIYEMALRLVKLTAERAAGLPAYFSDGFSSYWGALVEVYGEWREFARTGRRGRPRQAVREAPVDLVYGQVIKNKVKGSVAGMEIRVLSGLERLLELGLKVSTSLLERVNQTFRHALAPLVRKCRSFCKEREQLERRVIFFQAYYNCARAHQGLRELLPESERGGSGIGVRKWRERTPAMAAGLSDHQWTFRELLTAKFEPIHNQSISG